MASVDLNITGGAGPFTIRIAADTDPQGTNRYLSGTTPAQFTAIPDGLSHTYNVSVSNGTCNAATSSFNQLCPCAAIPSLFATADCSNAAAPKINVQVNFSQSRQVRVQIFDGATEISNELLNPGTTKAYAVSSGKTYTVRASDSSYASCKAADQTVPVTCTTSCTLSVTAVNPTC
ncbi:hypothetical protein GCM10028806_34200 [Spirosoma terrae]|uniref:Uncharacterized protein n=1 Tax=Spirosoma terrae TaxID=1968276 RepID=A0A6L9LA97_9BACT|nr:hypothetical protein [Spirosoma terrae]NDU95733.1 hypothetical protein [Spirosoma terrae]